MKIVTVQIAMLSIYWNRKCHHWYISSQCKHLVQPTFKVYSQGSASFADCKKMAGVAHTGKSNEFIAKTAWGRAWRLQKAMKNARDTIHPDFETPGRRQLKYKIVVSVDPKRTNVLQNISEQNVFKSISIITQFEPHSQSLSSDVNGVTHALLITQPITIAYNYPLKPLKSVYQENTPAPVWTHSHVGEAFPSVNFRFLYNYCFYLRLIYTQRKRTRKQIFSFDISSLLNVSI